MKANASGQPTTGRASTHQRNASTLGIARERTRRRDQGGGQGVGQPLHGLRDVDLGEDKIKERAGQYDLRADQERQWNLPA